MIPLNEFKISNNIYNQEKVLKNIISTYYKINIDNKEYEFKDMNKFLNEKSVEDIKKINMLIKVFETETKEQKWIVLFSDYQPERINGKLKYYSLNKEKSELNYGENILSEYDEKIIMILNNK